jgi:hypothetical protein
MPEYIKREPLTEEDYMTYGPNIAGFAWAILKAREELEQEGYTTMSDWNLLVTAYKNRRLPKK